MYNLTTLPNGLIIITDRMKEVETVSVNVWVNVGSRYEMPEQNGISHLLEHMAFKGTRKRNARQIAEEFDAIGGHSNAFTSREHTVYYAKVLKNNVAKAFDILADIVQDSVIDEEELEKERGVILQEIAQNDDSPDEIVFDHYQKTAYPEQAIGRPVLGSNELISKYTQRDVLDYIRTHYHTDRMVVCAAGNLEHQQMADLAEEFFTRNKSAEQVTREPAQYVGGEFREKRDLKQLHMVMGFRGLHYKDENFPGLQLLTTILTTGLSSRLFQEVREKRGLAYTIQSYISAYADDGLFSIYAGTSEDKAEELSYVICDELKKVCDDITEEELARAKVQMKAGIMMDQESTGARAEELGRNILCLGKLLTPKEQIEKIESISTRQISDLMEKIITLSPPTIASLGAIKQMPEYQKIVKRLS